MQAAKTSINLLRSTRFLPLSSRAFAQSAWSSASTFLDKQNATERVLNLLRSSPFIDPSKVSSTSDFKGDLQLDMLDSVQVMTAVEEEFAIEIPNSEADNISNTSQLIEFIIAHPHAQ